jgi:hypothetical protein
LDAVWALFADRTAVLVIAKLKKLSREPSKPGDEAPPQGHYH